MTPAELDRLEAKVRAHEALNAEEEDALLAEIRRLQASSYLIAHFAAFESDMLASLKMNPADYWAAKYARDCALRHYREAARKEAGK